MRLPDENARLSILSQLVETLPASLREVDLARLVPATQEFTGADLKRVIEDGKAFYAFDRASSLPLKSITDYFLAAVETVRDNNLKYLQAEAQSAPIGLPCLPGSTSSTVPWNSHQVRTETTTNDPGHEASNGSASSLSAPGTRPIRSTRSRSPSRFSPMPCDGLEPQSRSGFRSDTGEA